MESGFDEGFRLHVPGDVNSQLLELRYYEGTVWYKRTLDYQPDGNRLFVRFGSVNYPDQERLIHHSDRGSQYVEAGIKSSVGSKGDSYDNALAESVVGLFKREVVRQRGPWRGLEDIQLATLEWVHWYNHQRLLEPIGYLPPAEYEENYYHHHQHKPLETVFN